MEDVYEMRQYLSVCCNIVGRQGSLYLLNSIRTSTNGIDGGYLSQSNQPMGELDTRAEVLVGD